MRRLCLPALQALLGRSQGLGLLPAGPAAVSLSEVLQPAAASARLPTDLFTSRTARNQAAQATEASSSKAVQAAVAAAEEAAWVAGATPLSTSVSRGGAAQQQQQQLLSDARLPKLLGPRTLFQALGLARSFKGCARLLVAHREVVGSAHALAAAARMGELAAEARGAPSLEEQEAFMGAAELAMGMLRQEGKALAFPQAMRLLEAAAALRLSLTPEQAAAVEAAALNGLREANALQQNRLIAAYYRLGMQPGDRLAAALAPPCCRRDSDDASPAPPAAKFVPLDSATLCTELCKSDTSLRRLLRLLLLHQGSLQLPHLLAGVLAMGHLVYEDPRRRGPYLQQTFALLRGQLMDALAAQPQDAFDVGAAAQLLRASADLQVPPTAAQQAALEAAAVRGMGEATVASLHPILAAYQALNLQPASPATAAALQSAAEFLLHAAAPVQLRDSLVAWHGRGWAVTPALAAAAEGRALQLLRPEEDTSSEGVLHLLEGFTQARSAFPPSPELRAALRLGVIQHLETAPANVASGALSCCRKMGLLPDEELLAAFVEAAPRVLPVDSQEAFAFVPRLLMGLKLQGWHYATASPAVQHTLQALMRKQRIHTVQLAQEQHDTHQDLSMSLGLVCHGLHLLAAVGMRPADADLASTCRYLHRHQRQLSAKQKEWLRGAFEAWQYDQHGLKSLRRAGGGSD